MENSLKQQARDVRTADHHSRFDLTCTWHPTVPDIAEARRAVTELLKRIGRPPCGRAAEDACLVVSELVTNAVRHAPGPCTLMLNVSPDGRSLRITVRDTSPRLPRLQPRDPGRVGGHGLHLVRSLSRRLETTSRATGKDVTATVSLDQAGHADHH
jgi:anti-sigma regulatory factor (Ser/Thr protein kinase)